MHGVFDSFTDYPYGLPICCMPKIVINKFRNDVLALRLSLEFLMFG